MSIIDHELQLRGLVATGACRSLAEGYYDYERADDKPPRFFYSPEANQQFVRRTAKLIRQLMAAQTRGDAQEVALLIQCLSTDDAEALERLAYGESVNRAYVRPQQLAVPVPIRRRVDARGWEVLDENGAVKYEMSDRVSPVPEEQRNTWKQHAAELEALVARGMGEGITRKAIVDKWIKEYIAQNCSDTQKQRNRVRKNLRDNKVLMK